MQHPLHYARCNLAIFSLLLLTACSSLTQKQTEPSALISPPEHWSSRGKIALRSINPDNPQPINRVLSYHWQQQGGNLQLELSGALGFGRISIEKNTDGAFIRRGRNILSQAETLDQLLWQQTGVELPAHFLKYWLLGLPVTSAPFEILPSELSINGFRQNGWNILYPQLTTSENYLLPAKILASNGELSLRIAVANWQFSANVTPAHAN